MTNTIKITPEEDEAWNEAVRRHDIHERNKASMGAWNAAGVFITDNADRLGRITLRQAYEQGFMAGYEFARKQK